MFTHEGANEGNAPLRGNKFNVYDDRSPRPLSGWLTKTRLNFETHLGCTICSPDWFFTNIVSLILYRHWLTAVRCFSQCLLPLEVRRSGQSVSAIIYYLPLYPHIDFIISQNLSDAGIFACFCIRGGGAHKMAKFIRWSTTLWTHWY